MIPQLRKFIAQRNAFNFQTAPKFLGTLQQSCGNSRQEADESSDKWLAAIRKAIANDLVPALNALNCLAPRQKVQDALDAFGTGLEAYDLAHISDFNSLIAISQNLSKPVFELTDTDLAAAEQFGLGLSAMQDSRNSFSQKFLVLSRILMQLTV